MKDGMSVPCHLPVVNLPVIDLLFGMRDESQRVTTQRRKDAKPSIETTLRLVPQILCVLASSRICVAPFVANDGTALTGLASSGCLVGAKDQQSATSKRGWWAGARVAVSIGVR